MNTSFWGYDASTNRHPFDSVFSRTTWVSQHQKGKTVMDFNEARDDGVAVASAGLYANYFCTLLQTDNHIHTSLLNFYRLNALPDAQPSSSKH